MLPYPIDITEKLQINKDQFQTAEVLPKLKDGGSPEDRMKEMWSCLEETEHVDKKWNTQKWQDVRELLVHYKVITCDKIKKRGKAYCYGTGKYHPHEQAWKNKPDVLRTSFFNTITTVRLKVE